MKGNILFPHMVELDQTVVKFGLPLDVEPSRTALLWRSKLLWNTVKTGVSICLRCYYFSSLKFINLTAGVRKVENEAAKVTKFILKKKPFKVEEVKFEEHSTKSRNLKWKRIILNFLCHPALHVLFLTLLFLHFVFLPFSTCFSFLHFNLLRMLCHAILDMPLHGYWFGFTKKGLTDQENVLLQPSKQFVSTFVNTNMIFWINKKTSFCEAFLLRAADGQVGETKFKKLNTIGVNGSGVL